ncbi:bilirubin oxidase [Pseudomonas cavernae]|uniref:Multicopper oxidase CueO n=1 Tax=Pseudomonas cavernae TaxID=2320867 RepID=A0A385Z0P7_9PSED|nr:multicopper oxidase domain-containing protein [Pseudomonas cavernae]AYC31192.1 bilirubin oxidase [Pseudomonas cavernae]
MPRKSRKAPTTSLDATDENPASRRSFLKLSAAALAAPALLRTPTARAGDDDDDEGVAAPVVPPSPYTTPWVEYLPNAITPVLAVDRLTPAPTLTANLGGGEAGRDEHQRYAELTVTPPRLYELHAVERDWRFHQDLPVQPVWIYQANTPDFSPVILARYGYPLLCRIYNDLPPNHQGFGTPEISTHLHNLHCGSESDGFPGDYYSANKFGPTLTAQGHFKDHFYPNILAGYDEFPATKGDPREALGTLFYHDHTLDFTAPNLYRGLAGFYLLFDDIDSGNEQDTNPQALRLPSGAYDYPLDFCDRRFDPTGMLFYDQLNPEGILGDKVVINGKIEPVLRVARRKYRFRLLNTGPSRFYALSLVNANNAMQVFTYIANDGNLLPAPLKLQTRVELGVAERADIIVDFAKYPLGTELYLVNRMRQEDTRGPKDVKDTGPRILKFVVDRNATDYSRVPNTLRPLRPVTEAEKASAKVRRWEFNRSGGLWTINEKLVDVQNPRAKIPKGSHEIWELVNPEDGWHHPIHIHFEEGIILSKTVLGQNVPIPVHERGRKDVFVLGEDMTIRVFLRFRDFHGKYVMHCHNLIHEDHAMMVRWDIEDDDDSNGSA